MNWRNCYRVTWFVTWSLITMCWVLAESCRQVITCSSSTGLTSSLMIYEGWSKSSRPHLVLFRIKLKYYLLLIAARLRTRHAQCSFLAINILCILAYEQSVCQMVSRILAPELCTSSWRTSRTILMWPSKNLFHSSLFSMKRASTTSIVSQNNKACNGRNESVKIVISLHCVTPFFPCCMQTTDDG